MNYRIGPLLLALMIMVSGHEPAFRTSLTATVQESNARENCRDVVLSWRAHPAAKRYRVLVSLARDGAWADVPAKAGCTNVASKQATTFVDREAVGQSPADSATWLFYRVVAIGPRAPLDTTDVVPVELTRRKTPTPDLAPPK